MDIVDINIAVAEKVGWIPHPENSTRNLRDRSWKKELYRNTYEIVMYFEEPSDDGDGSFNEPLPKYSESLDLMHEAEKMMSEKEWHKYVPMLARVIAEVFDANVKISVPTNVLISATADKRAEAFLRVFKLWR